MVQKKYLFLTAGIVIIVAGVAIGGLVFWHGRPQSRVSLGAASSFGSLQSSQADANYSNGQNIPLTPAPTDSSGGLSADSSPSAGNLGQLSTNQNASSGSSASGSKAASASPFDPSTFSQYDKYQDPKYTGALMGDVQAGTGTALTSGHQASVYYKGWLTDGTPFDESRTGSNGQLQPFTFTLGAHQVIPGWEEGLAGMKVGGVRLLVIPPAAGYGATGQGSIPPNAVLVFEVQLVGVQ